MHCASVMIFFLDFSWRGHLFFKVMSSETNLKPHTNQSLFVTSLWSQTKRRLHHQRKMVVCVKMVTPVTF